MERRVERSKWRRIALFLAILYGATCLGTASIILTSPVCTQYGMAALIPAGPLVMLMGLFVILGLTVGALREGAGAAFLSAALCIGIIAALWLFGRSAWRALRSGPVSGLGLVLFVLTLIGLNAATTFAFCLSMSV